MVVFCLLAFGFGRNDIPGNLFGSEYALNLTMRFIVLFVGSMLLLLFSIVSSIKVVI